MNVLLQNPAVLLALVVVVARFVGKRLMAGKRNPAAPAAPPGEDAERTRRVREEVARKIAERRRESLPPVLAAAPADEDTRAIARVQPATAGPDAEIAEVLARQQKLVDQMRVLEGAEARPKGGFPAMAAVPASDTQANWLPRELNDPQSTRRAIVLREVLGAPRGLTLDGCLWR